MVSPLIQLGLSLDSETAAGNESLESSVLVNRLLIASTIVSGGPKVIPDRPCLID